MNESRQKGQFTGGHVIYGYSIVNKKVVINEAEADIVRLIFDRYASGVYIRDIMAELNEKGILNSHGRPFAKNTIHHILENEKYTGVYHYGGETFTNIYPRIVSDEVFQLIKNKKESNRYGGRKPDVVQRQRNGQCPGRRQNARRRGERRRRRHRPASATWWRSCRS